MAKESGAAITKSEIRDAFVAADTNSTQHLSLADFQAYILKQERQVWWCFLFVFFAFYFKKNDFWFLFVQ